MKRIILHWTAGKYKPNQTDIEHYHYLIDGAGNVVKGKFNVEANKICKQGCYAMHTGGGNTGSIGVAFCSMFGFKDERNVGDYPITAVQFERGMKFCAELLKTYNIELSPDTVITHYEFGQKHKNTTSYGKIDIIHIPSYPWVKRDETGSFIRSKVRWYLEHV